LLTTAFQQAQQKIKTVACPGLGTATGQVPVEEAARQMALAYRHYCWPLEQINWPDAQTRQQAIGFGGGPDLHFGASDR
jgi:O-acetyl-ADP-ribose deacetylase (regulator of RNase III)